MFFQFFLFIFFIGLAGLTLGTLISVKVWYSLTVIIFLLGTFCFGAFWFGVLIGATFFSWIPLFFTKFIIIIFCLGLAYFFFKQFHPSYGYFPFRGWIHWGILALFFFIIGLDFAIIGISAWFLLLLLPVFMITLFGGTVLVWKLKTLYRSGGAIIIYLPLLLLFFLALLKLMI